MQSGARGRSRSCEHSAFSAPHTPRAHTRPLRCAYSNMQRIRNTGFTKSARDSGTGITGSLVTPHTDPTPITVSVTAHAATNEARYVDDA